MNEQLLRELSHITEEEQDILDGKTGIDRTLYSEGSDFVITSEKMLKEGRLIQFRPHTRFVYFPRHTHNYVEMIYMCSGSTTHIINGTELILQRGELLILNQHASQEILPAGKEDVAVNFIILPEFFDQTLAMLGSEQSMLRDFVVGCLQTADSPLSYLHFKVSDILPVQNLLENPAGSEGAASFRTPGRNSRNNLEKKREAPPFFLGLALKIKSFISRPPLAARDFRRRSHPLSHSPDSAGCTRRPLWRSPVQILCIPRKSKRATASGADSG